jgi:hypothetical protein
LKIIDQDFVISSRRIVFRLSRRLQSLEGRGPIMKSNITRLTLGFAVAAQVLFFQNCSNTRFVNDGGAGTTGTKVCSPDIETSSKPVKILFVVDNSMSNEDHILDGQPQAGTDNGKKWRLAVMNGIVDRYGKNPNVSFGLGSFSGSATTPMIRGSSGQAVFSNSLGVVKDGIQEFAALPHESYTPYPSAVAFARETIQADIAAHPGENASYSVLMVSDGVPSQGEYDGHPERIIPHAQAIMDLLPGMIRLNSVFYYSPSFDEAHTIYLRNFSSTGKGTFLTADAANTLSIDGLVQTATETCQ